MTDLAPYRSAGESPVTRVGVYRYGAPLWIVVLALALVALFGRWLIHEGVYSPWASETIDCVRTPNARCTVKVPHSAETLSIMLDGATGADIVPAKQSGMKSRWHPAQLVIHQAGVADRTPTLGYWDTAPLEAALRAFLTDPRGPEIHRTVYPEANVEGMAGTLVLLVLLAAVPIGMFAVGRFRIEILASDELITFRTSGRRGFRRISGQEVTCPRLRIRRLVIMKGSLSLVLDDESTVLLIERDLLETSSRVIEDVRALLEKIEP